MGSKAQAKSSSEYAKFMKQNGIMRRTGTCPIAPTHYFPLGINGLLNHLNVCPGTRRK